MLLMSSIEPKKRLIWRKKNFGFRDFSPRKWTKTSFWGSCCRGPKGGVPPLPPPKFFGQYTQISQGTTYPKSSIRFFRIFEKIQFFHFGPFFLVLYMYLPPPSGCLCCSGNLFLVKSDRGQPKLSFDTPNIDIRWLLHHEKAWYILICSITSCKVMKYQVEAM